jgi:hypothetical protein
MNRTHRPLAPALSSLLLLLALAGCDRTDNTATGRAARRTPAATTTAAVPAATELEDAGQRQQQEQRRQGRREGSMGPVHLRSFPGWLMSTVGRLAPGASGPQPARP